MSHVQRLHHDVEWAMRAIHTHRAVLILDLAGHILAVNQACLGLFGYRRGELIGRPVVILLDHAEKLPERLQHLLSGAQAGEGFIDGLAQVAKSGRRFRADARICPIREEAGQVCLNVLFLREAGDEDEPLRALPPGMLSGAGQVIRLPDRRHDRPWSWRGGWVAPVNGDESRCCDR